MVISIGKCIGCNLMSRLDSNVCHECIYNPHRGHKWARTAKRIREDLEFAELVYGKITTDNGRRKFRELFGNIINEG